MRNRTISPGANFHQPLEKHDDMGECNAEILLRRPYCRQIKILLFAGTYPARLAPILSTRYFNLLTPHASSQILSSPMKCPPS